MGRFGNLCSDGWAMEEDSSAVAAVTLTSVWVWPDPAVLLNLTCYMASALAHLTSLRQPLATIWVSLSARSSSASRIAEVVDFPLLPHSLSTPPLPPLFLHSIHRSAIFFFLCCHPFTLPRTRCFLSIKGLHSSREGNSLDHFLAGN